MYEQHLRQLGLSSDEASIYETLVKEGTLPASDIAYKSKIGRTLAYKVLNELEKKTLVTKDTTNGSVAVFTAAHPTKLEELLNKQEDVLQNARTALSGVIQTLISDYNLASDKPGIRFFEGEVGIKEVLDDSLTSKTQIYTYTDIEALLKYIPEINKKYVAERERRGIKKRGIVPDTPANRKYLNNYHAQVTDTKFLPSRDNSFSTIMQIYDNKVSYLTLNEKQFIGVIISDPNIYTMHKLIFEQMWETLPSASNKSNPTKKTSQTLNSNDHPEKNTE